MKILIMDDDATVRFMLREICESAGWNIVFGSNGREGVDLFRTERADVVLVDYHMPDGRASGCSGNPQTGRTCAYSCPNG
ncbi:response regulator [Aneurinibacillus aneurinilyticus]|uniref:Chemotaxis protein CheY domain protein n=1 Tax=Aneurinibacillus aneurinilyticus ATCC 12856 TaxID=649747 RepID=U1X5W7_ANEAE|nr:response regulator [Aneurinibacillus aneurinilyticus]ERI09933.1 chemotaxis protein CheY domain protein [Aneurinibacillus aneurinilyticus ATCC 12856]MED0706771.1 response regulator [Aneurinibacillus aneurinilyticus]MED0725734.1 response regulator [Aneurinibacillus aneurinilyticus]MED0739101.1 response regulator [Aneurinibacillus aneurinilyticus]